jgi:hypothetical protein
MGVMSTVTRLGATPARYGGHDLSTKEVLSPVNDAVTPTTRIQWKTDSPTVIRTPKTASVAEADRAERQAAMYDIGVQNGIRVFNAEARRQESHAKLVTNHRDYLGKVADSHLVSAAANRRLAGKLHDMREAYAHLGHGLDRQKQYADQRVEIAAARYGAVG